MDHILPANVPLLDTKWGDVDTNRHGYHPKLDGTATHFMDSTGVQRVLAVADMPAGILTYAINQFRLTLTSHTPVTTADVTGAGTLYLTPIGEQAALNSAGSVVGTTSGTSQVNLPNGSTGGWAVLRSAEVSLSLTLTSGKNYDVFAYNSSGTLTLALGSAWTSDTARADVLDVLDGIPVNHATVASQTAGKCLYLGTIRASGTNTMEDSLSKRYVWNYSNRRLRPMKKTSASTSWTYATATWRAANGDSSLALGVLVGLPEDSVTVRVEVCYEANANVAGDLAVGIGRAGSTTTDGADTMTTMGKGSGTSPALFGPVVASLTEVPTLGFQSYQWLESATNSLTVTVFNDGYAANSSGKSYIYTTVMA